MPTNGGCAGAGDGSLGAAKLAFPASALACPHDVRYLGSRPAQLFTAGWSGAKPRSAHCCCCAATQQQTTTSTISQPESPLGLCSRRSAMDRPAGRLCAALLPQPATDLDMQVVDAVQRLAAASSSRRPAPAQGTGRRRTDHALLPLCAVPLCWAAAAPGRPSIVAQTLKVSHGIERV